MLKNLDQIKKEVESLAAEIRAHEALFSAKGYQGVPYYLREVGQDVEHAVLGLAHAISQSSADRALDSVLAQRSLEAA